MEPNIPAAEWTAETMQFVRMQIRRTLHELSVDLNSRGGVYICEILELLLRDPDRIERLSEPMKETADKYGIQLESLRSSIRVTLKKAWMDGGSDAQSRYFGNTISFSRGKPTESNFLITIAMHLRHVVDEYLRAPSPKPEILPEEL